MLSNRNLLIRYSPIAKTLSSYSAVRVAGILHGGPCQFFSAGNKLNHLGFSLSRAEMKGDRLITKLRETRNRQFSRMLSNLMRIKSPKIILTYTVLLHSKFELKFDLLYFLKVTNSRYKMLLPSLLLEHTTISS